MLASGKVNSVNKYTEGNTVDPYYNLVIAHLSGDPPVVDPLNSPNGYGPYWNPPRDNSPYNTNMYCVNAVNFLSQQSFSPYLPTSWSGSFGEGTTVGQYFTIPMVLAQYNWANQNYMTIECWIFPTAYSGWADATSNYPALIGNMDPTATATDYWSFGINNSGYLSFRYNNASLLTSSTLIAPLNSWSHIGIRYNSSTSTVSFLLNGVVENNTGITLSSGSAGTTLTVGRYNANSQIHGFVSNLRITNDLGLNDSGALPYTGSSTYTVPTQPLTANSYTRLLIMNTYNWLDNSSNNATVTMTGVALTSGPWMLPFSPFAYTAAYNPNTHSGSIATTVATVGYIGTSSGTVVGSATNLGTAALTGYSPNLLLSTDDFTIEGWIYTNTASPSYIELQGSDATRKGMRVTANNNSTITFAYGSAAGTTVSSTGSQLNIPFGWYHFAITRKSNVGRAFWHGKLVSTWQDLNDYALGSITIGNQSARNLAFAAAYSDLRIIKNQALYTSNFTPPTSILGPYPSGTIDISKQYVASFNVATTGQYVRIQNTFTTIYPFIEVWVYFTALSSSNFIINGNTTNTANGATYWNVYNTNGQGAMGGRLGNATTTVTGFPAFQTNRWYHLVLFANGGSTGNSNGPICFGVDGQIIASSTNYGGSTTGLSLATSIYLGTGLQGYMRELRISGYYQPYNTFGYKRPGAPLDPYSSTTITAQSSGSAGVNVLFLFWGDTIIDGSMSGNNTITNTGVNMVSNFGGTPSYYTNTQDTRLCVNPNLPAIVDHTGKNTWHQNTAAFGPVLSTSVKKFGTSSISFANSTSQLNINPNPLWDFNNGDFIIEMWIYPTSVSGTQNILTRSSSSTAYSYRLYLSGANVIFTPTNNGTTVLFTITNSKTLTANNWYYVAVYRYGAFNVLVVIDTAGNSSQAFGSFSPTSTGLYWATTMYTVLGATHFNVASTYTGYIDELRVTKGTSRGYTSTIFPSLPTTSFPRR